MVSSSVPANRARSPGFRFRNFLFPTRFTASSFDYDAARVAAIVPTYKPGELTVKLVEDLVRWDPNISVYVVDDHTPRSPASASVFERIAAVSRNVVVLCTPVNKMKAGALNFALDHIFGKSGDVPDVILSLDDDIVIVPSTVRNLVSELLSYKHLGAVCSQCRVFNKNANILTRLQGLEYLGFNATRLADEGVYRGPLVMHGMLTAFRTSALREVQGFVEGHLIEDYEITTRLKACGWSVKLALNAPAWTLVPETFGKLWRQRTRWLYGGITVVASSRHLLGVLQDLIGHGVFFATVLAIDLLILFKGSGQVSPLSAEWVIGLSLLQFALWYTFQLWLMQLYEERDWRDWALRVSILPEFIYSNLLTVVQIGGYLFLFFNILKRASLKRGKLSSGWFVSLVTRLFRACGYTESWGTRAS